jgi:hypothetical protein
MTDSNAQHHGMEIKLDLLHQDVSDMKAVLKELTVAINRLAIVEERQSETAKSMERAFTAIDKITVRLMSLEQGAVNSARTSGWIDKGIAATVGAVAVYVAKKLGIL